MIDTKTISVAYGDGIGPEIMEAVLDILRHSGAKLSIEPIEIGEKLYLKGNSTGISQGAWDSIHKNKIMLKAPITTPQGKGYKSLNVTFRKALGLFANVRPCMSYAPYIEALHDNMDMVIVRENEEDLYAGVEYQPTFDSAISHKIITREGSEKIIRYAFEYAKHNKRKKVTCLVKDNIMKIADGMFHEIFKAVAKEYPKIEAVSQIVDIGSARIASRPQDFDVIVTLNLYGDIVSDIAAEVSGSVGMAGSSNIGLDYAMFEAVHGSAPDIAGKGIANPSGLLNGAIMMLDHLGQKEPAEKIRRAWRKTLEDGYHTGDIFKEGKSKRKVSTKEFKDKIIENFERIPTVKLEGSEKKVVYEVKAKLNHGITKKQLIGFDVSIDLNDSVSGKHMKAFEEVHPDLKLHLVSNKGLKLMGADLDRKYDLITLRYIGFEDTKVNTIMLSQVIEALAKKEYDVCGVSSLYKFDDKISFTLAQGE